MLLVNTTSSNDEAQGLVTVQRSVTELPAFKPETNVVPLLFVLTNAPFAAPTTIQAPEAIAGDKVAAIVNEPLLH